MFKQHQRVRIFSMVATFLMIFSLMAPAFAASEADRGLHQSAKDNTLTAEQKVNESLLEEFTDENDQVTFLVKFSDKAEVKKVANEAENKASLADVSGQETQLLKRSAILSELKATSYESHKNVVGFLENQEEAGTVTDYHSYNIVNGMAVTATKDVAEKIAEFDEVEKLLKNETRHLHTTTKTDEEAPQTNSDDVEWNVERVNAPDAWGMGIDGSGTVVASLDSGAQWDHPALKEKYRGYDSEADEVDHEYSFFDATPAGETEAYDDNGHGTHVTGTMVGSEPDGSNQVGVAPGAEWISAKVFDAEGATSDDALLEAADWMLEPGGRVDLAPDVVNNSWGGGPGLDEWYLEAVENWREYGIFPEFSAGNTTLTNPGGPGSIAVPANYPVSFATGATDSDDMVTDFSLRGPSPYDEIKPDIAAPGQNIRSTVPGDGYEGGWNGTSMSGPAVAAVAAMLRQVNADITVDDMEEILKSTATERTDDEYPESPNDGYGYGLVDADEAVSSILDGIGTIEGEVTEEEEQTNSLGVQAANSSAAVGSPAAGSPVGASIEVLESGKTAQADSSDGFYSMIHPQGDFTVEASAYGFESAEQPVTVAEDETSTVDFSLEELPHGDIQGTVTDENTGNPIADAQVLLVEDANVDPVETDEDGNFTMTAYEGTYTVKVMARDYHGAEVEVTVEEGTVDVNVELEPYYTYPGGEIGYDDGTPDNARAFFDGGNGWAVKMSLPEGKDSAVVTDGVFKFWDPEFPVPGGTDFQVEVWDSSGSDGTPGEKLAGPVDAEALRDKDEWTVVDLSEHNIVVEDDFYMVYIQPDINDNSPGMATDESSPNAERSYQYVGGAWEQSPADEGNYMIRSRVAYEVEEPVITTPEEDFTTNEAELTVEGTASPTTTAQLMNNNEEVDAVEVGDDGEFSFTTTLSEGDNELSVVSVKNDANVGESESVTVTLDATAPELTIDNPTDGDKTNRETVTVEGTVTPENLDYVEVNGQKADVDGENYSKRILLDNGENVIEVTAVDEAGNSTTETVTLDVKYNAPEVTNVTPDEDMDLETGQSVKVEFESEPGLRATFVVHMPLTDLGYDISLASNPTELPMMEMADGTYVGYWTVPRNAQADGAQIEVKAQDSYGNETREKADGKLYINTEE